MRYTRQGERLALWSAFEFDLETLRLRKHGTRLRMEHKPAQLLARLLEEPGKVVRREELVNLLWPEEQHGDFDQRLNKAIHKVRRVLGDDPANPRFVQTLSRYGHRFIADVEFVSANGCSLAERSSAKRELESIRSHQPLSAGLAQAEGLSPQPGVLSDGLDNTTSDNKPVAATGLSPSRRMLVRSVAVASVLLTLLFMTLRFFGSLHIPVSSAQSGDPEIRSFAIGKEGALDPAEEGFKLLVFGQYATDALRNPAAPGWNRFKITSSDIAYYYRTLSLAEKRFALKHDWRLTCVCAVEEGGAYANIDFGPGLRRFDIELLREGDNYYVALTKTISPELTWEQKIEFAGVGDIDHPHSYELRFDHSTQTATLWIDGRQMASGYRGHTQFVQDRGLSFGAANYANSTGVGIFRSVRFEVRRAYHRGVTHESGL
jgi:DNA-binding winged helix-turn-helix (wHTH) protein